jgi:hypothetical protein
MCTEHVQFEQVSMKTLFTSKRHKLFGIKVNCQNIGFFESANSLLDCEQALKREYHIATL